VEAVVVEEITEVVAVVVVVITDVVAMEVQDITEGEAGCCRRVQRW
jgi:hypothetical protein